MLMEQIVDFAHAQIKLLFEQRADSKVPVINEKHSFLHWPKKAIKIVTQAFSINYENPL